MSESLETRIERVIRKAETDDNPEVSYKKMGQGVRNLLAVFQLFSGWEDEDIKFFFQGMTYSEMKKIIARTIIEPSFSHELHKQVKHLKGRVKKS